MLTLDQSLVLPQSSAARRKDDARAAPPAELPVTCFAMGPFDQLVLYLSEQRGRTKLDSLKFHVKIKQGPGETKAFVLRAQAAGFVNFLDGAGGTQAVSLTVKGRERVAAIKAGQPAPDYRADMSYYAGGTVSERMAGMEYVMRTYGARGGPEPLSVSLFNKKKKGKGKTGRAPAAFPPQTGPSAGPSTSGASIASASVSREASTSSTLDAAAASFVPRDHVNPAHTTAASSVASPTVRSSGREAAVGVRRPRSNRILILSAASTATVLSPSPRSAC